MTKIYINTNVLLIKLLVRGSIFTLLLTVMAMLIPNGIRAETIQEFKVLNIEWTNDWGESVDRIDYGCENWNLTPQQVQIFFETAVSTTPESFSTFDKLTCRVNGKIMRNGAHWEYGLNMGGYGSWWSGVEEEEPEYFVCREGACSDFVGSYPLEKLNQ